MANKLKKYQGNEGSSETKKRNPPKVKTRTVTTNPGGYSKTIVKTKTIDRPGKQGTTTTTRTRHPNTMHSTPTQTSPRRSNH